MYKKNGRETEVSRPRHRLPRRVIPYIGGFASRPVTMP